MATENLYAPPGAMVGDVYGEAAAQPVRLWPPKGRMGRVRMLAYAMAIYLIFLACTVAATIVLGLSATQGVGGTAGIILMVLLNVAYLVAGTCVMIQRSHDMDLSGWTVLWLLIPFVFFYWLFKRGTPGVNRFGAPPPPNSTGVIVLAWSLLIVPFLVGLGAAIAVPAYRDYMNRANARQVQSPTP